MWLHIWTNRFLIFQASRPQSEAVILVIDVSEPCASFVVIKLWLLTLFVKILWLIHNYLTCYASVKANVIQKIILTELTVK